MKTRTKIVAILTVILIALVPIISMQAFARGGEAFTVTIDFCGHGENVTAYNVPYGTILQDAVDSVLVEMPKAEGYSAYAVTPAPASQYDSIDAVRQASAELSGTTVTSDVTVYICWLEVTDEVRFNVKPPVCGMETATESESDDDLTIIYDWDSQTNTPDVTVEDADKFESDLRAVWIADSQSLSYDAYVPYIGEFEYGEKYKFSMDLPNIKFPYTLNEDTKVFVNDKELVRNEEYEIYKTDNGYFGWIRAYIECEHDWGEWEVVTEPTDTEPGLEYRMCNGNPNHTEERPIPPTGTGTDEPEPIDSFNIYSFTDDSQSTYTLGSGSNLEMTVKAEPDDSETFAKFVGVEIDGELVDPSNYDTAKGSLKLSLHADYLDTLENGAYTIMAMFNDGFATTRFKVTNADTATPTEPVDVSTGDNIPKVLFVMSQILCIAAVYTAIVLRDKKRMADYIR